MYKYNTGHRTFDNQANLIISGNIHANTMHGTQIRGKLDGDALQEFDLGGGFVDDAPEYIKKTCRHRLQGPECGWLYTFFHWNREGKKVTHGWVLFNHDHSETLAMWYSNYRWKTMEVVNICSDLIRKDANRESV